MQSPESGQSGLWHGTTILTVRKGGVVAVGGDGQVTIGQTIVKANAKKVRRLGKGEVIGGFAGATADAFTLFERLEAKIEQYPGQLTRAAVELAKDWRTDRYLRRLEAMMIVADAQVSLVLTGTGDVLEPDSGVMGIGSGGNYALAAARALIDGALDAEAIVRRGAPDASLTERRSALMRYRGQGHEITVSLPTGSFDRASRDKLIKLYEDGYATTFGQTTWTPTAEVGFFRALALGCVLPKADAGFELGLMRDIEPSESFGLGSAGFGQVAFKGGWGPEPDGQYGVRQTGIIGSGGSGVVV